MLSIINKSDDKFVHIELKGSLDSNTYNLFHEKVQYHYADSQQDLILDMAELQYLSSAGLRSIAMLFKQLAAHKAKIYILQPQSLVEKVLSISGFTKLMPIHQSIEGILAEN